MKININNQIKLIPALQEAQKGARVRTVDCRDIERAIDTIENQLKGMLYNQAWRDLEFRINPNAQSFANSYQGIPYATYITIVRGSNNWFITAIERDVCKARPITPLNMELAADHLLEYAANPINWK